MKFTYSSSMTLNALPIPITGPWDQVLSECDPLTLFHLSLACRDLNGLVASFNKRAYQITSLLARYFQSDQIVKFNELQEETGFLISGSFVLQFFLRVEWPESDLDLYVESRSMAKKVADFLLQCGYKYAPKSWQAQSMDGGVDPGEMYTHGGDTVENVQTFKREGNQIQIITCRNAAIETILRFHSTVVMNCITAKQAYCFYPLESLGRMRSLICYKDGPSDPLLEAVRKYKRRGWKQISFKLEEFDRVPQKDIKNIFYMDLVRWVGDEKCMIVPLDPNLPVVPETVMLNSWIMKPMDFANTGRAMFGFRPFMEARLFGAWVAKEKMIVLPGYGNTLYRYQRILQDVRKRECTDKALPAKMHRTVLANFVYGRWGELRDEMKETTTL